jgi:hypothetical protein
LTIDTAFRRIAPETQALKVEIVITTPKTAWQDMVNRIAFHSTMLTCELVAFKNPLANFAPL